MAPLNRRLGRLKLYSQKYAISQASNFLFGMIDLDAFAAGPSARSRLDDDLSLHVRVDRAQIVIVAPRRERERERGVLDKGLRPERLVLVQVTVVPGTTVISAGMKVLWSMLTVAAGPVPALLASSARQGAAARAVNRAASLRARRMLRLQLSTTLKGVSGLATKCFGSGNVKIDLLVRAASHRRLTVI
jgi:hypothetical protein